MVLQIVVHCLSIGAGPGKLILRSSFFEVGKWIKIHSLFENGVLTHVETGVFSRDLSRELLAGFEGVTTLVFFLVIFRRLESYSAGRSF